VACGSRLGRIGFFGQSGCRRSQADASAPASSSTAIGNRQHVYGGTPCGYERSFGPVEGAKAPAPISIDSSGHDGGCADYRERPAGFGRHGESEATPHQEFRRIRGFAQVRFGVTTIRRRLSATKGAT